MRYAVKTIDENTYYVVGPTGTFASNNTTVKDADDNYYAVVGSYIFRVPADDYASRVARAIVTIGKGQTSSIYVKDDNNKFAKLVLDGEDANDALVANGLYIKVGTEDYVKVTADAIWTSSYETANWCADVDYADPSDIADVAKINTVY